MLSWGIFTEQQTISAGIFWNIVPHLGLDKGLVPPSVRFIDGLGP